MRDPYSVLGVDRKADAKTIKSAYRKLAKKHHPDQNPDDPKAKERFSELNQAYEVVGDDSKRGAFDRGEIDAEGKPRHPGFAPGQGHPGGGDPFAAFRQQQGRGGSRFEFGNGGFDASDIFSGLFGQGGGQQRRAPGPRGADLEAVMDVSLEEAGTGAKVTALFPGGRKLVVKLPEFLEDGQAIRLKGQGEASPYGAGDAILTVRFKRHPLFELKGRDVHLDLPVPLRDAVLGAKLPVDTLTGRIAVTVPAWSSSDKVLRLKGRGMPLKSGGHGDLLVHVRVMLPEADTGLEALLRGRAG
ncbi:MAG: J domain-containing protein [Rhizobiaceae bacterium]